jgi:nitronate monooxygenase
MIMNGMPSLNIGKLKIPRPIIQGGMGVGISLSGLASSVTKEGGLGVIAAAGIGILEKDHPRNITQANQRALANEIKLAKKLAQGPIGVNIMAAMTDFDDLLATAMSAEADVIFMGAGLPLKIPSTVTLDQLKTCHTLFVPKISSPRAAELILQYWSRHYDAIPPAFVLEGPKAGGHLGFKREQLNAPEHALETLLPQVLQIVAPYEDRFQRRIPVIAAGGVYTGADILYCLETGAAGVKMGTRFVGTHECDAHPDFKAAYLRCESGDIDIIDSPVGLPGRAINNEFLTDVAKGIMKPYRCAWQCLKTCDIKKAPYCIAQALKLAKLGKFQNGFAFAGSNAYRVKELVSVKSLMTSLAQEFEAAVRSRGTAV